MLGKCLQKGSVDWGSAHKFHPTSWLHTPADSQPSLSLVVPSLNLFPCRTEEGRNEQALTSSPSMIYLVGELAVTVPAEGVRYQVAGTPDGEDSRFPGAHTVGSEEPGHQAVGVVGIYSHWLNTAVKKG